MPKKKPYAAVDSGTLLVIDPCYLSKLLNLSVEQEDAWDKFWIGLAGSKGPHVQVSQGQFVECGILLNDFGGDGIYSPEDVAHFLLGGNRFDSR